MTKAPRLEQRVIDRIKDTAKANLSQGSHIILYGSRARGDASPDSDWDLLVVLKKASIEQEDYNGIAYDLTALGWDLGEMIIPILYTEQEWENSSFTPFYKNVKSEGVVLV